MLKHSMHANAYIQFSVNNLLFSACRRSALNDVFGGAVVRESASHS